MSPRIFKDGELVFWFHSYDVQHESPASVHVGKGSQSDAADARFGYLTGGTQFLTATNGPSSGGSFSMAKIDQYSPKSAGLNSFTSIAGDWFMGQGGQGYFIHNYLQFQGFEMDPASWISTLFTVAGAYQTSVNMYVAIASGASMTAGAPVVAIGGLVATAYQGSKFRPVYQMTPCSSLGVNWCP